MSGTPTTQYLVTLTGPVANTYACLSLTAGQSEQLAHWARVITAMATDPTQPSVRIQPLTEADPTQINRLAYAEHNRLQALLHALA
ncbi:hypothetical protein [Nocardia sp. NPDC050435]|uniref:hypothetical protein n=1 Tax=Nocardia sp. NPDC050435 TaxID=3155040 RepID=UPI00340787B0